MFGRKSPPGKVRSSAGASRTVVFVLLMIVLLSLLLRIPGLTHTLNSDEAYDSLSVYENVEYGAQLFDIRLRIHPPLYLGAGIAFGKIAHPDKRNTALVLELMSLLASVGIVVLLYLTGRDWFDRKTGLLAAFFYAVLPASRVYDTWVKQDALMVLFVLLFLLFFFRMKYIASGIFLGLALLSKEPAAFIPCAVGVYLLLEKRFRQFGGLLEAGAIGTLMSFWWYVWFSTSTGNFFNFFIGRGQEARAFEGPWYSFIVKMPYQLGWITLAACLIAVAFFVARFRFERKGMLPLVLVWVVLLYAVFSISVGKPVWTIVLVLPAVALLAAWGLARAWDWIGERRDRLVAIGAVCLVLALALLLTVLTPLSAYMKQVDRTSYETWESERKFAESINEAHARRIAMYYCDKQSVLFYYIDAYDYGTLSAIMRDAVFHGIRSEDGKAGTVFLLDDGFSPQEFVDRLKTIKPDCIIVRPGSGAFYDRDKVLDALRRSGYSVGR